MTGDRSRTLALTLSVVGLALAVLLMLGIALLAQTDDNRTFWGVALVACLIVGGFALWQAWTLIAEHFRRLERLRGAILTLAADESAVLPQIAGGEAGGEIVRLHGALADLVARQADLRTRPDRRLESILAAVNEPVVVITEQGQVSLVNAAAKALLGEARVRVGTSVYAALSRASIAAALERAAAQNGPAAVDFYTMERETIHGTATRLGEQGGAVLTLAASSLTRASGVDFDLTLLDQPPPPAPFAAETTLAELPVVVFDTETTGLDVQHDRMVAIGAVRLHGQRIYRSVTLDRVIDPGRPIPPRSTAVHGITDAMVAGAQRFPESFAEFTPLIEGCLLVGHNVAFDIAMLRHECELAGLDWPAPAALDTLLLAAALDPKLPSFELESLGGMLGVEVRGRHTALGDALATAEVYTRLLPRLADAGVTTLGDAQAFEQKAKGFVKKQKQAWG